MIPNHLWINWNLKYACPFYAIFMLHPLSLACCAPILTSSSFLSFPFYPSSPHSLFFLPTGFFPHFHPSFFVPFLLFYSFLFSASSSSCLSYFQILFLYLLIFTLFFFIFFHKAGWGKFTYVVPQNVLHLRELTQFFSLTKPLGWPKNANVR